MQKAAEDLKKKQAKELEVKRKIIESRVPALQVEGLNQGTGCRRGSPLGMAWYNGFGLYLAWRGVVQPEFTSMFYLVSLTWQSTWHGMIPPGFTCMCYLTSLSWCCQNVAGSAIVTITNQIACSHLINGMLCQWLKNRYSSCDTNLFEHLEWSTPLLGEVYLLASLACALHGVIVWLNNAIHLLVCATVYLTETCLICVASVVDVRTSCITDVHLILIEYSL